MHPPWRDQDAADSPLPLWFCLPLPPPLLVPFTLAPSLFASLLLPTYVICDVAAHWCWGANHPWILEEAESCSTHSFPWRPPRTPETNGIQSRSTKISYKPTQGVSGEGKGLESRWGLLQGLKSCKHHHNRTESSSALTITTTRGSERNTQSFEVQVHEPCPVLWPMGKRLTLFGDLLGQCYLQGGTLK